MSGKKIQAYNVFGLTLFLEVCKVTEEMGFHHEFGFIFVAKAAELLRAGLGHEAAREAVVTPQLVAVQL